MFDALRTVLFVAVAVAGVYLIADEPVEVEVWTATWCGPCRELKAFLKSNHPDLAKMSVRVRDFDKEPKEARRLQVSSLPTTIVRVHGHEVSRLLGFPSARRWLEFVGSHDDK